MTNIFVNIFLALVALFNYAQASAIPTYEPHGPYVPGPFKRQEGSASITSLAATGTAPTQSATIAAPQDCGTFTLSCKGAEGACNNACYAISCVSSTYSTFTFVGPTKVPANRAEVNNNRVQSGANGQGGPVCGALPFSQKLRDPLAIAAGQDPTTATYDSDEFPMASCQQSDFQAGTIRNALRCIPASENQNGGAKLGGFINRNAATGGKTCTGKVRRGDTFVTVFDLTGADTSKTQYCNAPTNCANDGYQFHLTDLPSDGGSFNFPYENTTDNHYQITRLASDELNTPADILQCSVQVQRTGDDDFSATVFDVLSTNKGTNSATLSDDGDSFSVDGLPYPVTITKTGVLDTTVDFTYQPESGTVDPIRGDFVWNTDSVGHSIAVDKDGHYCDVGAVSGDEQSIECWFPCYAFALDS